MLYSPTVYYNKFKTRAWDGVLLGAGLILKEDVKKDFTTELAKQDILDYYNKYGHAPYSNSYRLKHSAGVYKRVMKCETWSEVLKKCGLKPNKDKGKNKPKNLLQRQ